MLPCGCSQVDVIPLKSGDMETHGLRAYRPDPYLLVTEVPPPAPTTKPGDNPPKSEAGQASAAPEKAPPTPSVRPKPAYSLQVIFLPNFNYGYAVQTKSGLGAVEGAVKLANGWQLTDLNSKIDTKIPETITAFTGLVDKALAGAKLFAAPGSAAPSLKSGLVPGLYRMDYDLQTGYFTQLIPVYLFTEPEVPSAQPSTQRSALAPEGAPAGM